jgi:hypothetical protein
MYDLTIEGLEADLERLRARIQIQLAGIGLFPSLRALAAVREAVCLLAADPIGDVHDRFVRAQDEWSPERREMYDMMYWFAHAYLQDEARDLADLIHAWQAPEARQEVLAMFERKIATGVFAAADQAMIIHEDPEQMIRTLILRVFIVADEEGPLLLKDA